MGATQSFIFGRVFPKGFHVYVHQLGSVSWISWPTNQPSRRLENGKFLKDAAGPSCDFLTSNQATRTPGRTEISGAGPPETSPEVSRNTKWAHPVGYKGLPKICQGWIIYYIHIIETYKLI